MEGTLREHLKKHYHPKGDYTDHEYLAWTIQDWLSSHGMEWTADDRKTVEEYGENPSDYMRFNEEQEMRIDEIYRLTTQLCELMIEPLPECQAEKQELAAGCASLIADEVAQLLSRMKYVVYFPVRSEDQRGEYITDTWE